MTIDMPRLTFGDGNEIYLSGGSRSHANTSHSLLQNQPVDYVLLESPRRI